MLSSEALSTNISKARSAALPTTASDAALAPEAGKQAAGAAEGGSSSLDLLGRQQMLQRGAVQVEQAELICAEIWEAWKDNALGRILRRGHWLPSYRL
jgi:hypothetical protein